MSMGGELRTGVSGPARGSTVLWSTVTRMMGRWGWMNSHPVVGTV